MTLLQSDVASNSPIPCTPDGLTGETGSKRQQVPIEHHQEDQDGAIPPSYTALPLYRPHRHDKFPPTAKRAPRAPRWPRLPCRPTSLSKVAPPVRKFPAAQSCLPEPDDRQKGSWGAVWCVAEDYRPGQSGGSQYPSGTGPTCVRVCVGTWKLFLDRCAPVISCVL